MDRQRICLLLLYRPPPQKNPCKVSAAHTVHGRPVSRALTSRMSPQIIRLTFLVTAPTKSTRAGRRFGGPVSTRRWGPEGGRGEREQVLPDCKWFFSPLQSPSNVRKPLRTCFSVPPTDKKLLYLYVYYTCCVYCVFFCVLQRVGFYHGNVRSLT